MERAVEIDGGAGLVLRGVLHLPDDGAARGAGVVLLSSGLDVRAGVWRMSVRLARALARQGHAALRFDFRGLGDSDGEHPHGAPVLDLYGLIQTGAFRDDAVAAARFLLAATGPRRLVLAGLCGGALTALFAGPGLPAVYGHVLVDLPVTMASSARQRYLEAHPDAWLRANPDLGPKVWHASLAKLASPAAWRRLVAGRSDYAMLAAVVRDRVARLWRAPPAAAAEHGAGEAEVPNPLVVPALRAALAAGQRVHLVNSAARHPDFAAHLPDLARDPGAWPGVALEVVPDANHVFSTDHARARLFDAVAAMARAAA